MYLQKILYKIQESIKFYKSSEIHEPVEMYDFKNVEFAHSHGTLVNSHDLTTCTSWVQASHRPSLRSKTNYPVAWYLLRSLESLWLAGMTPTWVVTPRRRIIRNSSSAAESVESYESLEIPEILEICESFEIHESFENPWIFEIHKSLRFLNLVWYTWISHDPIGIAIQIHWNISKIHESESDWPDTIIKPRPNTLNLLRMNIAQNWNACNWAYNTKSHILCDLRLYIYICIY